MRDWVEWHRPYDDPGSPLSRRLRLVQQHIEEFLDERPDEEVSVVSACAGQGHDLLGVLARRADARRVRATLLEHDGRNVDAASRVIDSAGLVGVTALRADAGDLASYAGAVPADLVLMAGVFGNIEDRDVEQTIRALPELCSAGATVIWTRSRRPPDRTPTVRLEMAAAGFVEEAFDAPADVLFSVGVHRLTGEPRPLNAPRRIFSFVSPAEPWPGA